ncbi:tetraspanin-32 isoform X3 [Eulemur rufifrons]|uniref:tetraspanin-32 isoform X3 n=1 Tax=Eulemur rufifrons TaxID=859984 RepID=UPI0037421BB8
MGPRSRVRAAKCQMLVTSFFVLLLGLSMATVAVLTYFGAHFAVLSRASLERNPYKTVHCWAFYTGMSLAGLLSLGAVLSAAATVREAQGLMAGAFLSFALGFCVLMQVAFWGSRNPTQVEDAALDTYDLVYDQVVKTASRVRQQELVAIQDAFLCCGKRSPFSLLGRSDAGLCQGEQAARQDCLQGIRSHLRPYQSVLSTLSGIGLALTGCALLLSAFLWFAVRSGRSLDRKGKYTLAARAHGCQPQEPGFFRHSQDGPATRAPCGADAAGDSEALGGSRTTDTPLRPLSCRRLPSACRDP